VLISNDAFQYVFGLLAATVRDLCTDRGRALGATLKPELYRRYRLTSDQYGFFKFGDFLRAAEAAGFIRLNASPGGDLEVWPIETAPPQQGALFRVAAPGVAAPGMATPPWGPPNKRQPVRVRPDLWAAFTSFSGRWAYSVGRDEAYKVSDGQSAESESAGKTVEIPSGRDRISEWMRSFASIQDPETKTRLESILAAEGSPYRFVSSIRTDTRTHKAWTSYHIKQVVAAIEAWASSHNLRPKDITMAYTRPSRVFWPAHGTSKAPCAAPITEPVPQVPLSPQPMQSVPTPPALTPRLAVLIDELIDQLLRLRGTLQVIEPKR
jgi:hypothetical protein